MDAKELFDSITGYVNRRFYQKREHLFESAGAVSKLMPILTNALGKIDGSFLDGGAVPLSNYALLPGKSGGQTLNGGTDSGDVLTLRGSAHATTGGVQVNDSVRVRGDSTNNTFTTAGQVALKQSGNAPIVSFHNNAGARIGFLQVTGTSLNLATDGSIPLRFFTGLTERAQIDTGGISFGNDALGHYLTSTWTPTILGSSSNPTVTYSDQSGRYTRIGNLVVFHLQATVNTISGGSGQARFTLPPLAPAALMYNPVFISDVTVGGTPISLTFVVLTGTSPPQGIISGIQNGGAQQIVPVSGLTAGSIVRASGFYFT